MGSFGIVSPRTCGNCPINLTAWWALVCEKKAVAELSQKQSETIKKIQGEPECIMPREVQDMTQILVNKIRCKNCGEIIESKSVHDFKFCKCKSVAVDGGHDYLRRVGQPDEWEDLSKCEEIEDEKNV